MHRDKFPEKVPFRLTRMMIKAMEVSGEWLPASRARALHPPPPGRPGACSVARAVAPAVLFHRLPRSPDLATGALLLLSDLTTVADCLTDCCSVGLEGNFRNTSESVMKVLRSNKDSVMAMLEAFVHDPLINWRLLQEGAGTAGGALTEQAGGQGGVFMCLCLTAHLC